ncbi:FkbM family methyltransferase [Alisedimentitalea sp. MJ-SS2]|uniref:FkbM family methyltransferase n=1 Tax=Aliisedimentitalea sp. MJ-SS2 TaxID=3049795 RepID=UPI0029154CF6|nr:FkbM family methyltransferase [Alisedimentitalea sp. MJ-SS2]MDU8926964.1 FkbM family methyltransferase [Alisedimentitalea sp. MJ-SS2]
MAKIATDGKHTALLLRVLEPERKMVIADVGARIMNQTPPYEPLRQAGACELVGFEPNEEAYDALVAANMPNSTYYNVAIGKPGKATFYNHPIGSISSLYPIAERAARFLGKFHWINRPELEEIPLTLTGLDKVKGLDRIDVLKIDIQGGEYEAIKSGKKVLSEAVVIIPEVGFYPMYDGAPQWRDVDALLHKMGFVLHKITALHHAQVRNPLRKQFAPKSHNSQLVDGDVIYVRAADQLDTLSDVQLMHLALAADTMFQSFDLVLACLGELAERNVVGDGIPTRYFRTLPDTLKLMEAAQ